MKRTPWWLKLIRDQRCYIAPEMMSWPYEKYREEILKWMAEPWFRASFSYIQVEPIIDLRDEDLIFQSCFEYVRNRIIQAWRRL